VTSSPFFGDFSEFTPRICANKKKPLSAGYELWLTNQKSCFYRRRRRNLPDRASILFRGVVTHRPTLRGKNIPPDPCGRVLPAVQ
jgi:hypothetical protein